MAQGAVTSTRPPATGFSSGSDSTGSASCDSNSANALNSLDKTMAPSYSGHTASHTATKVKRLDKATKAYINGTLRQAQHRSWCQIHGKTLPPPKLHPVILRVIHEWFTLVDDDGSGTLEHHELLAALQAARIPCDAESITEMIRLIDANKDGCIDWSEFEIFMMNEFAAGKHLLSGEYVLPSGMALPFGVMIQTLKRSQMMTDITEGGEARRKWLNVGIDLTAEQNAIAEAEQAIRMRKAYNETLHNRQQIEISHQLASQSATSSHSTGSSSPHNDKQHGSSMAAAAEATGFRGVRRLSWMSSDSSNCAVIGVIAGVPITAVRPATSEPKQQQQRQQQHIRHLSHTNNAPGTAKHRNAVPEETTLVAGGAKPAAVPRLDFSSLSGGNGDIAGSCSSSRQAAVSPSKQQCPTLDMPGVEPGSLLALARSSYWLNTPHAAEGTACTGGGIERDSVASHLHQQALLARHSVTAPLTVLNRLPSSLQQVPLTPSRPGNSLLMRPGAAGASRSAALSPTVSGRVDTARQQLACATDGNGADGRGAVSSGQRGLFAAHRNGVSPHRALQLQPSKDEWGAAASSCLAQQYSQQCSAAADTHSGKNTHRSSQLGVQQQYQVLQQLQHQQGQQSIEPQQQPRCQSQQHATAVANPVPASFFQTDGSVRSAQAKYLKSSRHIPPAALLSEEYIGPISAAVDAAHTPRSGAPAAAMAAGTTAITGAVTVRILMQQFDHVRLGSSTGTAEAVGSCAANQSQRAAIMVATNQGRALVTEQGQVLQVAKPQAPAVTHRSRNSVTGSIASNPSGGVDSAAGAGANGSKTIRSITQGFGNNGPVSEGVLLNSSVLATNKGNASGSSSSCMQDKPRHSSLAQKLVRPRGSVRGSVGSLPGRTSMAALSHQGRL